MSLVKIIFAALFLWLGIHLLLWSYLKRRIARAKAEMDAAPDVEVEGGCHCKAVRFRIATRRHVTLLDCNCSICTATAYLHLNVPHAKFTLLTGEDALTAYRFGTGAAKHMFCKLCGIKSFYQPRLHPDCYSVNFRCLDEGHELIETLQPFDGANWEEARAGLSKLERH